MTAATSPQWGFRAEDRVASGLMDLGCGIIGLRDERLDHVHKIDFLIVKFPGNATMVSLGVQITTIHDHSKLMDFIHVTQHNPATIKAIYLEIVSRPLFEKGGLINAVLAALQNFQFNREFLNKTIGYAVIHPDLTYEVISSDMLSLTTPQLKIIELPESLKPGEPLIHPVASELIHGMLTTYHPDKGFGYVLTSDGQTKLFAHISKVQDENLRNILNRAAYSISPNIPVTFREELTNKPFNAAVDLALASEDQAELLQAKAASAS